VRHNLGETAATTLTAWDLQFLRTQGRGPLLLDVRSPIEFESERIDGALNLPLDALPARLDEIAESADLVVICRTGVRATIAAETLLRAGRRARVLDGGMQAWRRARLPLREGRKRLPVDRQVQLIAGLMVLAGIGLGITVNPWLLALAAFFGAGLTFAGATGTCGLALVLMRMPWNAVPTPSSEGPGAVCAAAAPATPTCAAQPCPEE
jgi:rhodanese-related sulfurtransferase